MMSSSVAGALVNGKGENERPSILNKSLPDTISFGLLSAHEPPPFPVFRFVRLCLGRRRVPATCLTTRPPELASTPVLLCLARQDRRDERRRDGPALFRFQCAQPGHVAAGTIA